MTKFDIVMQSKPPHLAVMFRITEDGSEQFQWGLQGTIPLFSIIGAIIRVQAELSALTEYEEPTFGDGKCPMEALVITWDATTRKTQWFAHPKTPVEPMVGMLESIKETFIQTVAARRAASQQVHQMKVLGPDGQPMRN